MSKIQTASGRMVDVTNVLREDISLGDIATALANTCRFNGHVKSFYSVVQHSVLASLLVEAPVGSSDRDVLMLQRAALLHDAHEAYTGDIPRPLQHLAMHLDDCKYGISGTILEAFGLPRSLPGWIMDAVHAIDAVLLATEKRDVLPVADVKWPTDPGPAHAVGSIRPIGPNEARALFLARYAELWGVEAMEREEAPASLLFEAAGWVVAEVAP